MARWMALVAGAVILASTIAVVGEHRWNRSPPNPANQHAVTLLYVGAEDCAPCRSWRRGAGAAFRSSPEFRRVSYREVESPTVLELLKDEYWPDDLREYRGRLDRGAGVPLWLVISDHQIVERAFGESQWKSAVLPKLKSLLQ
jgi:hypothetical protein